MIDTIGIEAKKYLESLPRINSFDESHKYKDLVFLLPQEIDYEVNDNTEITTKGLSQERDRKTRDLIRVIVPIDPLRMTYLNSNVLTPLMYAESLPNILWHITTHAILYTKVTRELIDWIRQRQKQLIKQYGKHPMDHFWLSCSRALETVKPGEYIAVFNRRVDGWDGSHEKPVIELLGTGGHLPTIWDINKRGLRTLTIHENLQKEANEELGLSIPTDSIHIFGGYNNEVTHELVILSGLELQAYMLPDIEAYAIQNIDPDVMGLYLGTLPEVMAYYRNDPTFFAGGCKAAPTNFPHQISLMSIVEEYFSQRGIVSL